MPLTPPANIQTGTVVFRAVADIVDGPDVGDDPDYVAPTGTITFTASVTVVRDSTATPVPVSVLRDSIVGVLDAQGYLCTPLADGVTPGVQFMKLIATDNASLNPSGWTYNVAYALRGSSGQALALAAHSISVPAGTTVDLTTVGPVSNATPLGTAAADAAAAAAASSAAAAAASSAAANDYSGIGYDVIVVAGQSNASGYGDGYDALLDPVSPRVWQWAMSGRLNGQICEAIDPLFMQAQAPAGRIGFAMALGRLFADATKPNRRILIVAAAAGGSAFRPQGSGVWDPTYVGAFTNLYTPMVGAINSAIASGNNKLVGFFWLQGETDSADSVNAGLYQSKFDAMVTQLRTDVTQMVGIPVVLGQMVPDTIPTTTFESTVNATHIDTPRRLTLTGFAYGPTGYSQIKAGESSVHYNAAGQRALAPIMYNAFLRTRFNVLGTAPIVPTGVVLTQTAPTTATASWLQGNGRATDYNVQTMIGGGAWTDLTRAQSIDINAYLTGLAAGNVVGVRVRTVNEAGLSAWSATATATMVTVPAQVTGLAAGTALSTSVPLSWSAASGAASYLVEYKRNVDPTWSTAVASQTGLTASVGALNSATSYNFRVTARNNAGYGTVSSTTTVTTTAPNNFITDVGVTPRSAYGLRKLVSGYAGSAIKVRRSSDNTTQDIGFVGAALDTAALATFVGANSAFVDTWYDQSGSGFHFQQATTTKQPRIVNAGTLDTQNGLPAVLFDGVTQGFLDTTVANLGLYAGGAATMAAVFHPQIKATGNQMLLGETAAVPSNTSIHYSLGTSSGTVAPMKPLSWFKADDSSFPFNLTLATTATVDVSDVLHARWEVDDGTTVRQDTDGSVGAAGAYTLNRTDVTFTPGARYLGGFGTSFNTKGYVCEVVAFASVLTNAQILAGKVNQKSYYGTP